MKAIVVRQPWASLIALGTPTDQVSAGFRATMKLENEGAPGAVGAAPEPDHTYLGGAIMQDATCSVGGCLAAASKRGWCSRHYQRWWKYGDPLKTMQVPAGEQFATLLDWIARRDRSECWVWPYSLRKGYGVLRRPGSTRIEKAHRLAFELEHGRPLSDLGCHSCDNPACCNPAHIFDGTQADNMADAKAKGRLISPPRSLPDRRMRHKKLTPDDVRAIRADRRTQARIAADYGISQSVVSGIRSGKRWGWVA